MKKAKEIIDYINQLQEEAENGTDSIEVVFWTGTNTIKEMLEEELKENE